MSTAPRGARVVKPCADPYARVILVPFAGGHAGSYACLVPAVPSGVEAVALELPGRGGRFDEVPLTELPRALEDLARHALGYLDRPFVLFGHSLGARLAFELETYLALTHGLAASHLVLSGCAAPGHAAAGIARDASRPIAELLRDMGGTPDDVLDNAELMALLAPVFTADLTLARTPSSARAGCDTTLVAARGDRLAPPDAVLAFRARLDGAVTSHVLDGGHFYFLDDPRPLRRILAETLAAVQGS
jgi:medium-chain acyl-[acyl-carrier-protein] hydrolase